MRTRTIFTGAACLLAVLAAHASGQRDLGRETLQPENSWAGSGGGVTGGSAAVDAQVHTVTNRAELFAARLGPRVRNPVDVISAWHALNDADLGFDAGWTPTLNFELLPAWTSLLVPLFAGPFR